MTLSARGRFVLLRLTACTLFCTASCATVDEPSPRHARSLHIVSPRDQDVRDLLREMDRALEVWDSTIGYRRPVSWHIEGVSPIDNPNAGTCRKLGDYYEITIYLDQVSNSDQFCNVLLHELAHAHLACTNDADHVLNRGSLMYRAVRAGDRCRIDDATAARVRARWMVDGAR